MNNRGSPETGGSCTPRAEVVSGEGHPSAAPTDLRAKKKKPAPSTKPDAGSQTTIDQPHP